MPHTETFGGNKPAIGEEINYWNRLRDDDGTSQSNDNDDWNNKTQNENASHRTLQGRDEQSKQEWEDKKPTKVAFANK